MENMSKTIEALKNNKELSENLMRSNDGQALLRMLTENDGGSALQQAAQSAAQGNPAAMTKMIGDIMHSSEGAALISRINSAIQGK